MQDSPERFFSFHGCQQPALTSSFKSVLLLNLLFSCSSLPGTVHTWELTCACEFVHIMLDQTCFNFTWCRLVLAVRSHTRKQHLKASRTNPCLIIEYFHLGLIWVWGWSCLAFCIRILQDVSPVSMRTKDLLCNSGWCIYNSPRFYTRVEF